MDAEQRRTDNEGRLESAPEVVSWSGVDRPVVSASTRPMVSASTVGAAADVGRCKYPGCRAARQPRSSRRGAPPAYCADPTHEPDAARRERVRRRRLELELDVVLDEYDRPLPEPDVLDDIDGDGTFWAVLPEPRGPTDVPIAGYGAIAATELATAPAAEDPSGIDPGTAATLARRLADQLALAATAYEQLAEQIAETAAENAELRQRLQAVQTEPDSEPGSAPDTTLG